MSYSLTLRTGLPGSHQFSRYAFAFFEEAHPSAECAFVSRGADYLIEGDRDPIIYRLTRHHRNLQD
jgi:hypothetical protein